MLPTRFPRPESMGQGDITVWTNWICEENGRNHEAVRGGKGFQKRPR